MTYSYLDVKLIQQANIIAGKMIESGVSVATALYAAHYATSQNISDSEREGIFNLMHLWSQEQDKSKKEGILIELLSVLETLRYKLLSEKP
jgi:hypothetical protein